MCIRDRCIPCPHDISIMSEKVLKRFSFVTVITSITNMLLLLYLIVYQWDTIRDPALAIATFFLFFYGLTVTIYFYFARQKVYLFFEKIDAAVLMLYESSLCDKEIFLRSVEKRLNKLNKYLSLIHILHRK